MTDLREVLKRMSQEQLSKLLSDPEISTMLKQTMAQQEQTSDLRPSNFTKSPPRV